MTNQEGVQRKRVIRILVIDDEEIIHNSFCKLLSRFGYQIETVFSAEEGLDKLEHQSFDLVATDLMMPKMNGIEFLRALKQREMKIPAIMITGYPTIRTAVQAVRLGAVDYITKPFTRKELVGPILRALRLEAADVDYTMPQPGAPLDIGSLSPGTELFLPHHAWVRYEQDGTFLVGIEDTFLQAAGAVVELTLLENMEVVDQGRTGIQLTSTEGEEHGVAMPLTGQVLEMNHEVFDNPQQLDHNVWLLKILPSHLDSELQVLIRRP